MSVSAWRIVKRKHAADAFSGEGARLYGGRWNSPGVAMVYAVESRALAALEILIHLESSNLLGEYVVFEVKMDPALIIAFDSSKLPDAWRSDPAPSGLQAAGDDWANRGASPVLRVPSAIVPEESLFLLNPLHRDFSKLLIGTPSPFHLDPRLRSKR
ncbi:MAG: RES family NAD+ phosphorylase [Candidatus Acidiferrales bacterium]